MRLDELKAVPGSSKQPKKGRGREHNGKLPPDIKVRIPFRRRRKTRF